MDTVDLKKIGQRICERRKLIGMTQDQLAERMDVSIQMVSNLERGIKAIRIDNLVRLCQILGVSTDYILTGRETAYDFEVFSSQIANLTEENRKLVEWILSYWQPRERE